MILAPAVPGAEIARTMSLAEVQYRLDVTAAFVPKELHSHQLVLSHTYHCKYTAICCHWHCQVSFLRGTWSASKKLVYACAQVQGATLSVLMCVCRVLESKPGWDRPILQGVGRQQLGSLPNSLQGTPSQCMVHIPPSHHCMKIS